MDSHGKNNRIVLGILLIAIGVVLIAVNMQWIPFIIRDWLISWQMLLIVIGLVLLASKPNKGPGLILIFIGGFFMTIDYLDNAYYLHKIFWPSLIIFVGLLFIFRGKKVGHWGSKELITDDEYLDDVAVFGGGHKIITSKNFQGGKVTAIFGGSTIDLSQAQLANGINMIDSVTLFGGVKIIVPRDWDIHIEVTAIFGGFTDKRIEDPHIVHDPSKKLVVKGIAVFGGGELNYL